MPTRNTIGTRLFTWLRGELVGTDEFGNRYYEERTPSGLHGRRRRWVIYAGEPEPSKVPPLWHAWLHRTIDRPPSEEPAPARPWHKPHVPNVTGTGAAHRPPGDMRGVRHPKGMPAPYRPWQPES